MKKRCVWLGILSLLFCACLLGGCDALKKKDSSVLGEYAIMYSDGISSHTLTVTEGKLYSIPQEHIPQKDGYTFLGWYDLTEYGKQYVTPDGMCVQAFLDGRDIVLHPQFEAYTYKLVLDYGEANVTGASVEEVHTDESIPALPAQLIVHTNRHQIFKGWYTEQNCGGLMIADKLGISTYACDKAFRNLADANRNIRLYAGFELASYEVQLYSKDGSKLLKTETAVYGTDIALLTAGVVEDGFFITDWSTATNDDVKGFVYTGKVEGNIKLYVADKVQAVTVSFESAGGEIVAGGKYAAGTVLTLPDISRQYYKFIGWEYGGSTYRGQFTLPAADVTFTAQWRCEVAVYSRNAGLEINDEHTQKNPFDTIRLYELFGRGIGTMISEGYTKISVSVEISITELDDGYKEIYLANSVYADVDQGNPSLWSVTELTQGTDATHKFQFVLDLSAVWDTVYMCYSAHGNFGDTWKSNYLWVSFSIY
ncbi:MAG: InlB B-repeat-containing protein [Clostridia bacterium]|nr:InlB B-repeat-containing protein [Clostridia bacterium]